ncbi:MAG: hypothetical protein AAF288_13710 [Planctomycetota bacterium]
MDDERTRQSLVELAELFLTQVDAEVPRAAAGGPEPARGHPSVRHNPAAGPAPLRFDPAGPGPVFEPYPDDSAVQGIGFGPGAGPASAPGAPPGWTYHDPSDAAQGDDPTHAPAPIAAHVHAVMLGNLPGVSGPWLTQFAQAMAEQLGPVAVIYADRASAEIEVIEPMRRGGPAHPAVRLPPTSPHAFEALGALLTPGPSAVSAVVLSVGSELDDDECELLATAHRCTLLTGADDAAIVAGYARLKRLTEGQAKQALGDTPLGVAIMGSAGDSAQAAADKLAATSASFLETPLDPLGCLPRLEPARARRVGSYALIDHGWDRLIQCLADLPRRAVRLRLNGPEDAVTTGLPAVPPDREDETTGGPATDAVAEAFPPPVEPPVEPAPAQTSPIESPVEPAHDHPAFRDAPEAFEEAPPAVEPAPPVYSAAMARWRERPAEPASPDPIAPQPATANGPVLRRAAPATPEPAVVAKAPPSASPPPRVVQTTTPSAGQPEKIERLQAVAPPPAPTPPPGPPPAARCALSQALGQAWSRRRGKAVRLHAIAARKPDALDIELAVDDAGRLHLLMQADPPSAIRRDRSPLHRGRKAALALLEARRWAAQHRELLASTCPELGLEPTAKPACHLFVHRGDVARKMLDRVGADLSVHVLEPVAFDDGVRWVCVALS